MIKNEIIENNDYNSVFFYIPNFLNKKDELEYKTYLDNMNDFVPCYNHKNNVLRLQKWYQVNHKYFCKDWNVKHKRWFSFSYDKYIFELQNKIQNKLYDLNLIVQLNSCLINKYVNGKYYISNHRDSIISFGEYPTICILSLGEPRTIKFNRLLYNSNNYKSIKLNKNSNLNSEFLLESGSLFIMSGSSQKYFVHEVPKTNSNSTRYSLTFREFLI